MNRVDRCNNWYFFVIYHACRNMYWCRRNLSLYFFVFRHIHTTSNMVFLGDNQNSVCILSAPEVVGICLRSIVALGSLSLPTPSSSASSHNCVGSCRYSATNNLNILFNFSTVGKWTVLRLSPILCHCLGNGVAITCKIGTPENKITMIFETFDGLLFAT